MRRGQRTFQTDNTVLFLFSVAAYMADKVIYIIRERLELI